MHTVKLVSPSPLELVDSLVIEGDVRLALSRLPSDSVPCVVTSPPYWGLRDYGISGQIGLEPTLGEAEKSHQSAKQDGFVEFCTIYNVPALARSTAHEESPTTNRFYCLRDLLAGQSGVFDDFRERLISLVGIVFPSARRRN